MDKLNSYGLILSFVNRKKWNYCAVFWENYVNIRFKFYTCFKHIIFLGEGFYRNCIGSNTLILFGVKWVFFCNVFLYVKKILWIECITTMQFAIAPLFLTILLNDIWS